MDENGSYKRLEGWAAATGTVEHGGPGQGPDKIKPIPAVESKGEKKNSTEVYREAFSMMISLLARMPLDEVRKIKQDLVNMGGTDNMVVLQHDILDLIIERKAAGSALE